MGLNRSLNFHTMTKDKGGPEGPQPTAGDSGHCGAAASTAREGTVPKEGSRIPARHPAALCAPAPRSSPALLQQHGAPGSDAWKGGTAFLNLNY